MTQDIQAQLLNAYVARDNLAAQLEQVESNIRDLRNFLAGAQSAAVPLTDNGSPEPSATPE